MLLHGLRWLLPWLLTLGVSTALAYGAEAAFQHNGPVEQVVALPSPIPPGALWVRVSSYNAAGEPVSLRCLAAPNAASADQLEIQIGNLDTFVDQMCQAVSND